MSEPGREFRLEAACRIAVVVPDDGTDLELMSKLLKEKGITRADSVPTRAVSALREAHTKRGKLPEPALARLVTVIVPERDANAVFEFVYEVAKINRPGGGMIKMGQLLGATDFTLPEIASTNDDS